jgi:two-component system OmpR family response regulator
LVNILLCEDDKNIRKLMYEYLIKENYNVYESSNGEEALNVMDSKHIDLLITDIMMPEKDGYTLSSELRESGYKLPILMITAKGALDDKKTGFHIGVDDYMVKPVDMEEMVMRVTALLRRSKIACEKKIDTGSTVLLYKDLSVSYGNKKIELPKKEFLLLFKLLSQPDRIFTRMQIMDEIWGLDSESDYRTVDVHIKRLREKFRDNNDFQIITVKGLGYKAVKLK